MHRCFTVGLAEQSRYTRRVCHTPVHGRSSRFKWSMYYQINGVRTVYPAFGLDLKSVFFFLNYMRRWSWIMAFSKSIFLNQRGWLSEYNIKASTICLKFFKMKPIEGTSCLLQFHVMISSCLFFYFGIKDYIN